MADKEVQISKTAASVASTGKKTSSTSSKAPQVKAGSSNSSNQTSKSTQESQGQGTPPMREVLEILRVLNANVNKQSERMDKQDQRIEDIVSMVSDENQELDYYDEEYDYDENESTTSGMSGPAGSEQNSMNEPKSIFKKLSDKFQQTEQVDIDVHPDLANLVNNSFRNGLSDENLEEVCKDIHRPQNCDSLVKTRVNQGIWRLLKSYTQAEDSRLTSIQGVLLKASMNVVKLVEKLGASDSEHVELGTTAIALLGHANKMINTKRKDLHKADLDHKYHYLASASLPYTDLLYGNDTDVNNNVREINNMNRIGRSVGRGGGPVRGFSRGRRGFNPYPSRGRGIRGRGRGMFHSRPDSGNQAKNPKPQKK